MGEIHLANVLGNLSEKQAITLKKKRIRVKEFSWLHIQNLNLKSNKVFVRGVSQPSTNRQFLKIKSTYYQKRNDRKYWRRLKNKSFRRLRS